MTDLSQPSPSPEPDDGKRHLVWIGRFQLILLPLGALAWLLRSPVASLAFLAGAAGGLAFWHAHRFLLGRMLTPSRRGRWLYAVLALAKLALLGLYLRAMMGCFFNEAKPLATGLLIFVAAILLEAGRLVLMPGERSRD